jgi:hypothetical protein
MIWQITKTDTAYTGTHRWFADAGCTLGGDDSLGASTRTILESGSTLVLRFCTTSPTNESDTRCHDLTRARPVDDSPGTSAKPVISDSSRAEPPPSAPTETANPADKTKVAQVAVAVTGNGVVTAPRRQLSAAGAAGIACGFNRFNCYTKLKPGQRVRLQARPLAGWVFKSWTGPCAAQGPVCVVVARQLRAVAALFAPARPRPGLSLSVAPPNVRVRWRRSIGDGRLVLSGRVGGKASLRIELRRPGGAALQRKRISVAGGRLRHTLRLRAADFPRGARVLPGGFIVAVTGSSGGFKLPFQLRTVVVPAPPEGVTRQAFATSVKNGPPTARLPRRAKQAYAYFRFATQPAARKRVTVTWYQPNGARLGTVKKANRPEIVSNIGWNRPLPPGAWIAELRAGGKIVNRLSVRIG